MIVYRFERNGVGPYLSQGGTVWLGRRQKDTRTQKKYKAKRIEYRKAGDIDFAANWYKAHNDKRYVFGCKSKDQLRAYFGGEFKFLFKQGFRIKRYRVPDHKVIDMVIEVAFPVKYHKFQTVRKMRAVMGR